MLCARLFGPMQLRLRPRLLCLFRAFVNRVWHASCKRARCGKMSWFVRFAVSNGCGLRSSVCYRLDGMFVNRLRPMRFGPFASNGVSAEVKPSFYTSGID